jgi:DNA-binding helix-hairpin-helix protein with protein kinase domain
VSSPRIVRTQNGRSVVLGNELGKGGEGIVYELQGNVALAAKLYHKDKAAERQQKIEAIVAAQWHKTTSCVAFPIDALLTAQGQFLGFTMARIARNKPIHDLYSPTSRKTAFPRANFPFLIHTALNIATAVANVHHTGCVIGDINHSGILIADNAIAVLIDCDSFQVTVGPKTFICKVGVPDFTPPELQGQRLDQFARTPNHDAFGLAVVIFNLLFMGRHPFAGRFLGRGDIPPLETAIAQYRFAYSSRKHETQTEPPPNVPVLSDVPQEMANAFETAFGQLGVAKARPTALDWVNILKRSQREIKQCTSSHAHQYFRTAPSCPWCRMENAYPGFLAFAPPIISVTSPMPINLAQLIAAIRGVPDPGTAPELAATMQPPHGSPSFSVGQSAKESIARYIAALVCAFVAIILFRLQVPGPALGLFALAGSIFLALRESETAKKARQALNHTTTAWTNVEAKWAQWKNNANFLQIRTEANTVILQLQNLGGEENRRIADLKARQRDIQLNRFLEKFYISSAKIKNIGRNRKIVLRSYGIETAADVQRHGILQINGFGPVIAGSLVAWRTSIERKFVFKPNEPLNPADVSSVRSAILKEKSDIETKLRQCLTRLERASNETRSMRNSLQSAAVQCWKARKQAESECSGLASFPVPARLAGVGAVMLLSFTLLNASESLSTKALPAKQVDVEQTGGHATNGNETQPNVSLPLPAGRAPESRPDTAPRPVTTPPNPVPKSTVANPEQETVATPEKPPAPIVPSPTNSAKKKTVNPLVGPDISLSTQRIAARPSELPSLEDVSQIQSRLRDLGFLSFSPTGVWDGRSREALQDFKVVNRLGSDGAWTVRAGEALASPASIRASQSFIGRWCGEKREPPLLINSRRASSSTGGVCEFAKFESEKGDWRAKAVCTEYGRSWTANIRFVVRGNKLVWSSESGSASYLRCR